MSKWNKKELCRVLLILLAICAAAAILAAGVFFAAKHGNPNDDLPEKTPSSTATCGFLDEVPLPVSPQTDEQEDAFALYDVATDESIRLSARELLIGAVACEMDLFSPREALKAQAVACYTLFCRKRGNGETIICDSEQWSVWTDEGHMRTRWGEDTDRLLALLDEVASETEGQVLEYEGQPILAAYFAISAGATEDAENVWQDSVPCLTSVASPGDAFSDGFLSEAVLTQEEFLEIASRLFPDGAPDTDLPPEKWLDSVEYTPSGYVKAAKLFGKEFTGPELRNAFDLRSAAFSVDFTEGSFHFRVKGWGHGVGMSQAGAVFLAKRGVGYEDILSSYYPGAELVYME